MLVMGALREVTGSLKGIDVLLQDPEAVSFKSVPRVSLLPQSLLPFCFSVRECFSRHEQILPVGSQIP